jgi:hypothetical protein
MGSMAHFVDTFFCVVAVVVPPVLVFCMRRGGLICGALVGWLSLVAAGEVLRYSDPASRNELNGVFDLMWFALGWMFALLYCLPFYLIRIGIRRARERRVRRRAAEGFCVACGYDCRANGAVVR